MIPFLLAAAMGAMFTERASTSGVSSLNSQQADPTALTVLVSLRLKTNGDIQQATGDSGTALFYSTVGSWVSDKPPENSGDFEAQLAVNSSSGTDTATYSGNSIDSFLSLGSQLTWTLSKDDTTIGDAVKNITVTVRHATDTGNTSSTTTTHTVEVVA